MIWFFGIVFVYAGMLCAAPWPTIKVSAVFAALLYAMYLAAYLTFTARIFG